MKKLYCLFDAVAKQCSEPFMVPNFDCAKRTYGVWCAAHKDLAPDSVLLELGDFDDEIGSIKPSADMESLSFADYMQEVGVK